MFLPANQYPLIAMHFSSTPIQTAATIINTGKANEDFSVYLTVIISVN